MISDIGSIELASILREGGINFKILSAKSFLEKIPAIVPLETDAQHRLQTEINIQCFLLFAIGSIDIAYGHINTKLNLGIKPYAVKINTLCEQLRKKIIQEGSEIAKKLLIEFTFYIQEPEYEMKVITQDFATQYAEENLEGIMGLEFWTRFENKNGKWFEHAWNRENSSLWELRELRNATTHGYILKQSRQVINSYSLDGIELKLNRNIRNHHDKFFILNPHEYFTKSLEDIIKHTNTIEQILR